MKHLFRTALALAFGLIIGVNAAIAEPKKGDVVRSTRYCMTEQSALEMMANVANLGWTGYMNSIGDKSNTCIDTRAIPQAPQMVGVLKEPMGKVDIKDKHWYIEFWYATAATGRPVILYRILEKAI